MTEKHTPGEWVLEPFGRGVAVVNGDRIIAECKARNGSELASCEANARLIAAASDLLAACRDLIVENDKFGGCPQSSPAWTVARTAIAKAEKTVQA